MHPVTHIYIWYGGSPVAGAAYAGAGVLKSGGGCGRVPITRQGRGGGGAVGRETGYGDRIERQPDDRGQSRRREGSYRNGSLKERDREKGRRQGGREGGREIERGRVRESHSSSCSLP